MERLSLSGRPNVATADAWELLRAQIRPRSPFVELLGLWEKGSRSPALNGSASVLDRS